MNKSFFPLDYSEAFFSAFHFILFCVMFFFLAPIVLLHFLYYNFSGL